MRAEDMIQMAIFNNYRARACDGVFAFAVPNAGKRSYRGARAAKATGLQRGVPDMIWLKSGQVFGLEVKTEKGKLKEHQASTLEEMEGAGAICHVAYGLDDALRWLERNNLLKGSSV